MSVSTDPAGKKGKTPPNQSLMPDSRGLDAERALQPPFRKIVEISEA
jgi:hypothetical protein